MLRIILLKYCYEKEQHKHCVLCKKLNFSMLMRAGYILIASRDCICLLSGLGCISF